MSLRTVPRTAVDIYLRAARVPLNLVARGEGSRLLVDRADATARLLAGRVLRDEQLIEDARRRQIAADQRENALRMKVEAEQKSQDADAEFTSRQRAASERRAKAAAQAAEQQRAAEQRKNERKRGAADIAAKRKSATAEQASRAAERIQEETDRARLRVLDEEAQALAEKQAALKARREAQRLEKAAAEIKEQRKRNG